MPAGTRSFPYYFRCHILCQVGSCQLGWWQNDINGKPPRSDPAHSSQSNVLLLTFQLEPAEKMKSELSPDSQEAKDTCIPVPTVPCMPLCSPKAGLASLRATFLSGQLSEGHIPLVSRTLEPEQCRTMNINVAFEP